MTRKRINNVIRSFLVLSWIYLLINVNIISVIEGRINPVVKKVQITYIENNKIYGKVDKIRECDLVGMEIYIKDSGNYQLISTEIPKDLPEFGIGEHSFGPMTVNVSKEHLKKSRLRLFHECNNYLLTKKSVTVVDITDENTILAFNYN
jgi:hypothetical protein